MLDVLIIVSFFLSFVSVHNYLLNQLLDPQSSLEKAQPELDHQLTEVNL